MSAKVDEAFIEEVLKKLRKNKELARKLHYLLEEEFVRKVEIKEILKEMRESRAEWNKRFEQMREESNKRFEQVDKRLDKMDRKMDSHFSELSLGLGLNLEGLSQSVVKKLMEARGYKLPKLKSRRFVDPEMEVHKDSTDVQVDLFSEKPLIIGEVTGSIIDLEKVERFIRKIHFIEKQFKQKATLKVLVTYRINPEIRKKVRAMLRNEGVELITIDD